MSLAVLEEKPFGYLLPFGSASHRIISCRPLILDRRSFTLGPIPKTKGLFGKNVSCRGTGALSRDIYSGNVEVEGSDNSVVCGPVKTSALLLLVDNGLQYKHCKQS